MLNYLLGVSSGNVTQVRWLTCANSILRYYIGTKTPSISFIYIVSYIPNAYAVSWFRIKTHPYLEDGAKNFFKIVQRIQLFCDKSISQVTQQSL